MSGNRWLRYMLNYGGRLSIAALIVFPILWVNSVVADNAILIIFALLAVAFAGLDKSAWARLPGGSGAIWRVIVFGLAIVIPVVALAAAHPVTAGFYALSVGGVLAVSLLYGQDEAATKLGVLALSTLAGLVLVNIAAGPILNDLETPQERLPPPTPVAEIATIEAVEGATPLRTEAPQRTATALPSPTVVAEATPEVFQPVPGFGYVDYLQDGGEAEWSHITGYGPRVNTQARAYMYDVNGNLIYDTLVAFNGKGSRGPEATYEKPDDVYRILIVGDSFVEALQVEYEQTFYALLQDELATLQTAERRFEVLALGRTGWGTLQEYLYYRAEGHKFDADLVVLSFFINDVSDNFPAFFYPDINNTNFDYVFENDSVQMLDTNQQPLPPNQTRRLYNALPKVIRETNLARLLVRLYDPPLPIRTPGGVLERVHPQFYIYVTEPEVEGYDEAWSRTERGLELLANAVERDGGRLAVMPIFLGAELVQNVSQWFPELVVGWQWDDGLPERRLAAALADLPATLVPTRPVFEAYAQEQGAEVYNLLYLPEDGHFNALGHELTKDVLLGWMLAEGIVGDEQVD